ncbi:hypothetical protein P152DRAFT_403746 [Eremomyces bilateralis CBS 781.70]|uniref:Putative phospholipase n=1 Tax=Eremomyces bilateralis CBS 781.70 TaxID=1392243 RepID=A0A6G1FU90_9PEZI|nr:uncharacterized protein P152DRAFT_403746 [Eremomyces bilateralis CBS 781.70]KAF1809252.1 hypothetical protein P152DRAFT_403746 [Eremomyces bilateralis CBS 781.70]
MGFRDRISGKGTGRDDTAHKPSTKSFLGQGGIPNAKKPKTRPPTSIRDQPWFLHASLPTYSGPYTVGVMAIEVPAENPRVISEITREGHHILRLETVLMNIYYPAAHGAGSGKSPSGKHRWSRETWLPRPRLESAKGYGKFAGAKWAMVPFFFATTMFTKIPAFRNAGIAEHWPPGGNVDTRGTRVKQEEGEVPEGEEDPPVFPLMVFCHGLGGTRTVYSSVCGEFASYGFVVCAIEHRDGSGPRTIVLHEEEGEGSVEHLERNGVDHHPRQRRRGWDKVDYIYSKYNPDDTAPTSEQGIDKELRHAQLQLRLAEIEEAYNVLAKICNGQGQEVANKNLRRKGYTGASSNGLQGIDWTLWKHRFHLDQATILGHSFGAATAISVLRHPARFPQIAQGVTYDIWSGPVHPSEPNPAHKIRSPLLGINSEAFMYWPSNFHTATALAAEARAQEAPAWLLTLRGTVHLSQSDFSLLYPTLTAGVMRATADPQRAMDLNINATLEFLGKVSPVTRALIARGASDERILDVEPLEVVPDIHRPDDRHLGFALKVPHVYRHRVAPGTARRWKRMRRRWGRERDAEVGESEVWMHVRSEVEEVERFLKENMGHGRGMERGKDENEDVMSGSGVSTPG